MKNLAKLIVFSVFVAVAAFGFACSLSGSSSASLAAASPTPPAAANTTAATPAPPAGDKKIPKSFVLSKDSLSEYGEAPFDHDTHAFGKYNPEGTAVVGCVECHHTDQPKSALKPPLVTSEREVVLTMASWQTSTQKVSNCRTCHFQDGNVPEGKEMPTLNGKDLNNEYSYHVNCNTCHDAAFKARPTLKSKKGFATSKDCLVCHAKN
ncbi:MAG: cytochrome c3 family protein [Acidobacteria bacterium]|nr:cytochrome c3 family protein [Acidobacteriota bacterium]MBP7474278.1 cytochrome c3 family protein [Pyrinomonadaceae bacterium]MBP9108678.1 cytochrome c3 family protein [Pyrinomonadaceae bacterium]